MAVSNFMKKDEMFIRDAIENGISAASVNLTISNMLNKTDTYKMTPKQIKNVIETIVDTKTNSNTVNSTNFSSDYIRKNNNKIIAALNNGIEPNEIVNSISNVEGKKLKFTVKLISKMKKQELRLRQQKSNNDFSKNLFYRR